MLVVGQEVSLKRPWRFELMWLEHEGFASFLREVWNANMEGSGGFFRAAKRLKFVKEKLKEWNKHTFKCNETEIGHCLGLIAELDGHEERGDWSEERRIHRCMVKLELDKLWRRQEISWRQKSRETVLTLGDRNTVFFHKMACHNRRKNFVDRLEVDGVMLEGQTTIAPAVVGFYKRLYLEDITNRPFPNSLVMRVIGETEAADLVRPFLVEEVRRAVMNCAGDKAPGPDGFNLEFFKQNWRLVQEQVMLAFADFFSRSKLPNMVSCTFVCLIPKKEVVEDVRDFRPISLTSSLYKILSKVLLERLLELMPVLVSKHQCAFVSDRQILDAALIANELIDSRRRSGKSGLVIKLDIEKAYDHVNWNCLLQLLIKMCFPGAWIRWIQECISSPSFSVLVNGEVSGFFKSSRGLRQGDSLSPFLFILVMDVLSGILGVLKDSGAIDGFCMDERTRVGEVTHLLYADDSIVFCEAHPSQVRSILAALIVFQAITGLKVNLNKSSIIAIGQVDNLQMLADILGCGIEKFPCSYLGLPLGSRAVNKALWDPVVTKVRKRLETWKARNLSFGGRMVLIKSVLSNLPVYFLSIFRAPVAVIEEIEKIQNNFLWTGLSETRKLHLVSWDKVKVPKERGGLGIMDLRTMNKALLSKWLWRFGVEREAWWRSLIKDKFGLDQGSDWRAAGAGNSAGWSIWSWILKESSDFWKFAYVDPGRGDRVRFWHDIWVPGQHFVRTFPRIAAVAQSPDAFVADMFSFDDRREWRIDLTSSLRGGAQRELIRFQEVLQTLPDGTVSSGPPRLTWKPDERCGFSVHSFVSALMLIKFPGSEVFPSTTIWISTIPTKVCCSSWMASLNAIATIDNLRKRGMMVPNRCSLCCMAEESVGHLLLHCPFSSKVWSFFAQTIGVHGPLPRDVLGLMKGWKEGLGTSCFAQFRKVLHQAVLWYLWLERNRRIFDDRTCSEIQTAWKIAFNISRWLQAHKVVSSTECSKWLNAIFHPP
ncbi:LINE-1 retrotransposable element ORF2 protein [Linum grandiflorum]